MRRPIHTVPSAGLLAAATLLTSLIMACGGGGDADLPDPGPVITTGSGLQYQVLKPGLGDTIRVNDFITVHYSLWLEDGTLINSTKEERGGSGRPYSTQLSPGGVITGWIEGIPGMRLGEIRKLIIPPDLAYGEEGLDSMVPPNSTLTFEVEAVSRR
jgi:FKBP-type peptidyl-prolyl cis-trans isomerase